jgi:hypothetical protein
LSAEFEARNSKYEILNTKHEKCETRLTRNKKRNIIKPIPINFSVGIFFVGFYMGDLFIMLFNSFGVVFVAVTFTLHYMQGY